MNKELLEQYIVERKTLNEMANIHNVDESTIRYWLKKYNLKSNNKRGPKTTNTNGSCKVCNKSTENNKMYCSSNCKVKQYYINNPDSRLSKNISDKNKVINFKLAALKYCGESCKLCGYNKNISALTFHHIDPNEKDFALGGVRIKKDQLLTIEQKSELDKCITLCNNCHTIVHYNHNQSNENQSKATIKSKKVRRSLIDLKGGHCKVCNLKSNINDVYAFHHIDPKTKAFNIDARVCNGYKYERLLEEVSKCDLLCHNCHTEIHNPEHSLDLINKN